MKIRLKQILASMLLACTMAVIMPFQLMTALAAEAKISFSDPSVMVGKSVSVTMKVDSVSGEPLGGADVTLSYDPNVLEFVSGTNASGGAGSVRVIGSMDSADTKTFKFTLKFKALQAGKTSITVARQEVNDVNTQPVTVSKVGNSAVNVTPLATYSNDANLKSLKIDPGTLTPEFSSKVTEYTATVGGDVSKLVVSAGTSNANAKVVISGTELKEGENTVVCKVTAEDGETVKKYTIKVTKTAETASETPEAGTKTELGDIKATVDGTEYFVATAFDSSLLPAGFQAGKTAYQGGEVASATGNGMTLFYLADASGNGGFYVYDEASAGLTRFTSVSTAQIMVIPSALDEGVTVPQGFVESSIEIDGNTINGWVWSSEGQESPYFVFYGTSSSGQKDFYRYDATEKTLQRYFQDPNADSGVSTEQYVDVAEKYNSLIKDYKLRFIIICVLIALSLLLLIIVVMLVMGRKGSPYDPDDRMNGKKEKKSLKKASALDFLEDDEDDGFDDYYDEPYDDERDDERSGVRARKDNTRTRTASSRNRYEDSGEDDFEEIEDLEDMERSLAARLAREAELSSARAGAGSVQTAGRRKTSEPGYTEKRLGRERGTAARPVRVQETGRHVFGYDEDYDTAGRQSSYDAEDEYMGEAEDYEAAAYEGYEGYGRNVRPVQAQRADGRQHAGQGVRIAQRPSDRRPAGHQAPDVEMDGRMAQEHGVLGSRYHSAQAERTMIDQETMRRPVQGQEASGRPVQGQTVRRPVRSQEAAGGRLVQGQEALGRPVRGQEAAGGRAVQGQEAPGRPVRGQEAAGGRAVQGQEAPGRPVRGQEASGRHVRGDQEAQGRPVRSQEASGRHVRGGQEAQGRPVRSQEASGRHVQGQEASGRPVRSQEASGRHVQGQEASGRPVRSQEASGRHVQNQGAQGRPVRSQEASGRLIHGQEASGRPVQGQGPVRRPSQELQPNRPARPQSDAAAYRQPQRRPGPQEDDDFEFIDLD